MCATRLHDLLKDVPRIDDRMFYLTLHGETEWNRERRFQGQLDSPLTGLGVEQAYRMGAILRELLSDSTPSAIVSSHLGRARRTAEIICQVLGIAPSEIETDARLAEIDLGSWAGSIIAAARSVMTGETPVLLKKAFCQ
ncbi:MAG: histidine phosphatase family protein [Candidatus Binataceae bacterium]